jgi:hypothetical protein
MIPQSDIKSKKFKYLRYIGQRRIKIEQGLVDLDESAKKSAA